MNTLSILKTFTLSLIMLFPITLFANGIQVSNVILTKQNNTDNTAMVQFDLSWQNSWRWTNNTGRVVYVGVKSGGSGYTSSPTVSFSGGGGTGAAATASVSNGRVSGITITNAGSGYTSVPSVSFSGSGGASADAHIRSWWDAAWVFVKFRVGNGDWQHAILSSSNTDHITPSSSIVNATSDGMGVFIYRSTNGSGANDFKGIQLRWNYGANSVSDDATVQLRVFAIEMVYIPGGHTFRIHDFDQAPSSFKEISTATANTSAGNPQGLTDLNANWPNGYNAYYCMKYELSQGQYRDFLNTLTREQQNTRTATSLAEGITNITNRFVMSNTSTISNRNGIRCNATVDANQPIIFYCDFDADGIPNETTDGEWIACNFLNWGDGTAYLDWAGLRPMTEMEFEKAGRGAASFVNGEFAWGNNVIANSSNSSTANYTITGSGTANENINSNYVTTGGNALYAFTESSILGPARVGIFAANTSNFSRETSGASYYGIMELSGNLWERTVPTGLSTEGGDSHIKFKCEELQWYTWKW